MHEHLQASELLTAVRSVATQQQPDNTAATPPALSTTASNETDNPLLQALLDHIAQTAPGEPVVLRDFVKEQRIGNARATQAFRTAVELGALQRTETGGYVAAGTGLIQGAV